MRFQTNGKINDIYSSNINNIIFFCGNFTQVGTNDGSLTNARNLAMLDNNFKYRGNDFFKMDPLMNYGEEFKINKVISFDNDTKIIVAGSFFKIGNIMANNIAMFNLIEQKWYPLGTENNNGILGSVLSLKYFDNKIAVGGIIAKVNIKNDIQNSPLDKFANNIAIFDLSTKIWHPLEDGYSEIGGGVSNAVFAIDVINKSPTEHDIYVGGRFSSVKTTNINLKNTFLLAKFTLKSLSNKNLNQWSSVFDLSNIYKNDKVNYEPTIYVINATHGIYGGKFNGYINYTQVCNIFRYNGFYIQTLGLGLEFTHNNNLYTGEVRDIKLYNNESMFISGCFNNNIVKYNLISNIVSQITHDSNNYNGSINTIAWVNTNINNQGNIRIGRLFVSNDCITNKKLIYNVPVQNISINENWSYSFYDNIVTEYPIQLSKYLNDSVYNINSFQHSYYDSNIKLYLRSKFDSFQKNIEGIIEPVLINSDRLDSVLEYYDSSFNETINNKTLFCLIKENLNEINLNNYNLPISCYFTCINGEQIKLKMKNKTYTINYVDNGGINKKCVYESFHAGLGQTLFLCPSQGEKLIVRGFGSLLNDIFCFTKITNVLTPRGYINITKLKIGDYVINSNYQKVKIVNIVKNLYKPNKLNLPYLIPKNSIDGCYPPENLELSSGHLIKYKDKWIHPEMSKLFKQKNIEGNFYYYHIQLEDYERDNLIVNGGAVIESFSKPSERELYFKRLNGTDNIKNNNLENII